MNHTDHVALLQPVKTISLTLSQGNRGQDDGGPVWAELGAGDGAFTLALADLLGAGTLHTIDRDAAALARGAEAARQRFPAVAVLPRTADFTQPLPLPPLDGLLMANALHFVREPAALLGRLMAHLKPGGIFLLVEYNADRGNPWVPYPLSFETWTRLAQAVGLSRPVLLGRYPSRFLHEIYSAAAVRPPAA